MRSLLPGISPLPLRWAVIGALSAGLVAGVVGLVVGLRVHPATAWFAIFELGIPSSIFGGLLGLASGAITHAVRSDAADRR
jgi:hypothetical protein